MKYECIAYKHLFGLRGVSQSDIRTILDTAMDFRQVLERPVEEGTFITRSHGRQFVFENK